MSFVESASRAALWAFVAAHAGGRRRRPESGRSSRPPRGEMRAVFSAEGGRVTVDLTRLPRVEWRERGPSWKVDYGYGNDASIATTAP